MSLDHLLLWLSAKGEGSWSQFRAGVEELHVQQEAELADPEDEGDHPARELSSLPVYQAVRFALERLGHVEFFCHGAGNGWRVVPPVIAFPSGSTEEGLLCGARSPALLECLRGLDNVEVIAQNAPGMPQRLSLQGSTWNVVASVAKTLGLYIQPNAPEAILSTMPGVRDSSSWRQTQTPDTPGWTVHRFSASNLRWVEYESSAVAKARRGLFRFVMKHQRFYYLYWDGRPYHVPVQTGKYAVMHRCQGRLSYDAASGILSLPPVCRPPLLIERALILCSGFLPQFNPSLRRLEYSNVSPGIARLAAQLLQQEM